MYKDKTQIVKSDKYLDWLVNFTEKFRERILQTKFYSK